MSSQLPELIDGLPNFCGAEDHVESAVHASRGNRIFLAQSHIDFGRVRSAFANALHMHQPLIPAGGLDLGSAQMISHLKYMMDNPDFGDNHNAPVFHWCYKRMGDFIPQLVDEGKQPRVMLEYSGTLLHGLRHMGLIDVFDNLKRITCDPKYRGAVEWLGCPWGHAVGHPRRYRIIACTSERGSITLPRFSASKRSAGYADFLHRKWRCPIIRT